MADLKGKIKKFWENSFHQKGEELKSKHNKTECCQLVQRLREHGAKKVLDLGCGFGRLCIPLAQAGFDVMAVDLSENAIKIIKEWADEEDLDICAFPLCAQDLEQLDEQFDGVICYSMLDHVTHIEAAEMVKTLREKIIRPEGIAVFTFDGPDEEGEEDYITLDDESRVYTSGDFDGMLWRYYTDEDIRELFKDFTTIEFKTIENGSRMVWVIN